MPHRVLPAHLYSLHKPALPSPEPAATADCDPQRLLRDGFHELLGAAPGDETAALAFALSLAARASAPTRKGICFCHAGSEAQERGRLYGHGLAALGVAPEQMLVVAASGEKDLLWTLEEAVTSGAFGAVVGALTARERLYDFAASRRLKLRVTAKAAPLYLIRHWQARGATAAHGRWRVGTLPSQPEMVRTGIPLFVGRDQTSIAAQLLGPPRLRLGLERMNGLPPQQWEMGKLFIGPTASLLEDEIDVTRGFHLAALLENRPARKPDGRHRAA